MSGIEIEQWQIEWQLAVGRPRLSIALSLIYFPSLFVLFHNLIQCAGDGGRRRGEKGVGGVKRGIRGFSLQCESPNLLPLSGGVEAVSSFFNSKFMVMLF